MKKKSQKTKQIRQSRADRVTNMDKEILDTEGAALVLGVSKSTIYKLAQARTLPGVKVGKEWRFSRRKLIAWVSQGAEDEVDDLAALLKSANVRARK